MGVARSAPGTMPHRRVATQGRSPHGLAPCASWAADSLLRNRMRPSLRCALLAPILLLALPGCDDDPTSLDAVAGEYHLELYQGEPLPATVGTVDIEPVTPGGPSYACEQQVVSAELTLGLDGSFSRQTERRLVCDQDRPDETTHIADTGRYTLGDDGLRLSFDVPAGASYTAYTELARRTPDALVVYRAETTTAAGTTVNTGEQLYRPE